MSRAEFDRTTPLEARGDLAIPRRTVAELIELHEAEQLQIDYGADCLFGDPETGVIASRRPRAKRSRDPEPVAGLGGKLRTVKQAALICGVTASTIRRWCREGSLAYTVTTSPTLAYLVRLDDVQALADGRKGVSAKARGGEGQTVFARACQNPACGKPILAVPGKQGGGTKDKRHCSFECQQATYRRQVHNRLKAGHCRNQT